MTRPCVTFGLCMLLGAAAPIRALAADPPASSVPASATAASPPPLDPERDRALFSGGRLAAEALAGLAAGGAAGYASYRGLCGDELCVSGYLVGSLATIATSTGTVYGTGRLLGGRGTFAATALGTTLPFIGTALFMQYSPLVAFGVGLAIAPFTAAWMFEQSSQAYARPKVWPPTARVVPFVAPVVADRRLTTIGGFAGTF